MKKFSLMAAAFAVLFMLAGCKTDADPANGSSKLPSNLVVTAGESQTVTAGETISIAENQEKEFSISATRAAEFTWTITAGNDAGNVRFKNSAGNSVAGSQAVIEGKKKGGNVTIQVTATNAAGSSSFTFIVTVINFEPPANIVVTTTGDNSVEDDDIIEITRKSDQAFTVIAENADKYEWEITSGSEFVKFSGTENATLESSSVIIFGKSFSDEETAIITVKAINSDIDTDNEIILSFYIKVLADLPAPVVKDITFNAEGVVVAANGKLVIDTKTDKSKILEDYPLLNAEDLRDYTKVTLTANTSEADLTYKWMIASGSDVFVKFEGTDSNTLTAGTVTIVSKALGTAAITVTAADADGEGSAFTFQVEVVAEILFVWSMANDPPSAPGNRYYNTDMHRIAGSPYYFRLKGNSRELSANGFVLLTSSVLIVGGGTSTEAPNPSVTETRNNIHVPGQFNLSRNAIFRLTFEYADVFHDTSNTSNNGLLLININNNNNNWNGASVLETMSCLKHIEKMSDLLTGGAGQSTLVSATEGKMVMQLNPMVLYQNRSAAGKASLANAFISMHTAFANNTISISGIRLEQVTEAGPALW